MKFGNYYENNISQENPFQVNPQNYLHQQPPASPYGAIYSNQPPQYIQPPNYGYLGNPPQYSQPQGFNLSSSNYFGAGYPQSPGVAPIKPYDQLRQQEEATLSRNRRCKILGIVLITITVVSGVVAAIVVPIVITNSASSTVGQGTVCARCLNVYLTWNSGRQDLDLNVTEPGGTSVNRRNSQGTYGTFGSDLTDGPGPETYFASAVSTSGTFVVAVQHNNDGGDGPTLAKIVVEAGLSRNYQRTLYILQNQTLTFCRIRVTQNGSSSPSFTVTSA